MDLNRYKPLITTKTNAQLNVVNIVSIVRWLYGLLTLLRSDLVAEVVVGAFLRGIPTKTSR